MSIVKLYVMRHGPAEDAAPSGLDSDRALSREGRERTRAVARALLEGGEAPLTVISSPLVRAVQTAEIVTSVVHGGAVAAERADASAVTIRREMAPGGAALRLVLELARAGLDRAMLVGHEPDVSTLVSRLVDTYLDHGMRTAMVVGVEVDAASGEADALVPAAFSAKLLFVLDPATLTFQR